MNASVSITASCHARGLGQGIMEYWNVEDPAYRGWELRIEGFRD